MRAHQPNPFSGLNAVTGIAGILFGIIVGYIIGAGNAQPVGTVAAGPASQTSPHAHLVDEGELQAFRNILKDDPKNIRAAVQLGNKLYDAGRFDEAIPYYRQGLAGDPKDVNVSTDLATAIYYAGRPDEALTQIERSLSLDPEHGQTLFNLGIIRRDGKNDRRGAVEAWERLLKLHPDYPEAARVRTLIAETRQTS
jgi:cytochrome c-type biogenesis protein CcmH/NrfG